MIGINDQAPCYDKNWLRKSQHQHIGHNNTIIMTDVMGSRGFGDNRFTDYFRGPQTVKLSVETYRKHYIVPKVYSLPDLLNNTIHKTLDLIDQNKSPATEKWMKQKTSSYGNYQTHRLSFHR